MDVEIRNYTEDDWEELRNLIDSDWEKNHPLTDKELFDWQYKGYGEYCGKRLFKLLFVDGKLEGFRGVIPGRYQYYEGGKRLIKPGVSYAVWLVTKKYRGQGLGYKLLKSIEEDSDICVAIGSNPATSVPIYRRNNYDYMDFFRRYVIPLSSDGYFTLLSEKALLPEIKTWEMSNHYDVPCSPSRLGAIDLESIWDKATEGLNMFSLYRDRDFWQWRYIDTVGFRYLFFGDVETGVLVGRIETVIADDVNLEKKLKVFRLIEVIPAKKETWLGKEDRDMERLLSGVLAWAKVQGCVAADFQCSSSVHEKILLNCGFRLQDENYGPPVCSLAGMFQPLVWKPAINNIHWKIKDSEGSLFHVSGEHTYFVKSDNDRDRPVLWPLKEE